MKRILACFVALLPVACGPVGVGLGLNELFKDGEQTSDTNPGGGFGNQEVGVLRTNTATPCFTYGKLSKNVLGLSIEVKLDGVSILLPTADPRGSITAKPDDNVWEICFLRPLTHGLLIFEVVVRDQFGNETKTDTSVDVDLVPPAAPILFKPAPIDNDGEAILKVNWDDPSEELRSVTVFLLKEDELKLRAEAALEKGLVPQLLLDKLEAPGAVDPIPPIVAEPLVSADEPNLKFRTVERDPDDQDTTLPTTVEFAGLPIKEANGAPIPYHVYAVAWDLAGNASTVSSIRGRFLNRERAAEIGNSSVSPQYATADFSLEASQQVGLTGNDLFSVQPDPDTDENSLVFLRSGLNDNGDLEFTVADKLVPPPGAPPIDFAGVIDATGDRLRDAYTISLPDAENDLPRATLSAYAKLAGGGFALRGIYEFDVDLRPQEIETFDVNLDGYIDVVVRAENVTAGKSGALVVIRGFEASAGFGELVKDPAGPELAEDDDAVDWADYNTIDDDRDVTRTELDLVPVDGTSGLFDNDTYADYTALDKTLGRTLFGAGTTDDDPIAGLPDGTYQSDRVSVPNGGPVRIDRADFNRDGMEDLVTSNGDGTVSVLLARKTRVFDLPVDKAIGETHGPIVVADFSGDTVPDIAVAGAVPGKLTILISKAIDGRWNGEFEDPLTRDLLLPNDTTPIELEVTDFNLDGGIDFLVVLDKGEPRIMLADPAPDRETGAFTAPPNLLETFYPVDSLVMLDANGDGLLDVLAGGKHSDLAVGTLFRGSGLDGVPSGRFLDPQSLGGVGSQTLSLARGDYNRDGVDDVAMAGPDGIRIQVGTALRFLPGEDYTFAASKLGVHTISGDFNHDGILDLATLTEGDLAIHMGRNNDGSADATFLSTTSNLPVDPKCGIGDYSQLVAAFPTGYRYELTGISGFSFIGAADFDGDGGLDLMVNDTSQNSGLAPLYNFGRRCDDVEPEDKKDVPDRPGYGQFGKPKHLPVVFKPIRFRIGYLNDDDIPDVVAIAQDPGLSTETFCVMIGKRGANGYSFERADAYYSGVEPVDLALADVDRDGRLDVIILDAVEGIFVLTNTGDDGKLDTANSVNYPVTLPANAKPMTRLAVGHLDFDVALDLAIGCQDGVRVIFGDS